MLSRSSDIMELLTVPSVSSHRIPRGRQQMCLMRSPARKVLKRDTHRAAMWRERLKAVFEIERHTIIKSIMQMRYKVWPYINAHIPVLYYFQHLNVIIEIFPTITNMYCFTVFFAGDRVSLCISVDCAGTGCIDQASSSPGSSASASWVLTLKACLTQLSYDLDG